MEFSLSKQLYKVSQGGPYLFLKYSGTHGKTIKEIENYTIVM